MKNLDAEKLRGAMIIKKIVTDCARLFRNRSRGVNLRGIEIQI